MEIRKGDVVDINGTEYEVEELLSIDGMGTYVKWKGMDTQFALKNMNWEAFEKCLIRRG